MTPSIPIFRNEINALGNFRDGVNIASEFTRHALAREAHAPFGRRADRASNGSGDFTRRRAIVRHQNNPGALSLAVLRRLRATPRFILSAFLPVMA